MPVNSIQGLASGYKTDELINAIMDAERGAARLLERKKKLYDGRLEAVRTFNVRTLSAKLDLIALRRSSTFTTRSVDSSAPATVTATASNKLAAGAYQVTVDQMAQAHQQVTTGFASASSSIGTGSVTLRLGAGPVTTLEIDASKSSLAGLAAAINASDAQVTAQVINDGSATPYRLALTAKNTGAANTISFDADGLSGGDSALLQRVTTTGTGGAYTGAVSFSGAFTGADGPPEYRIRVANAAPDAVGTATFEFSKDGGTTWSAPLTTSATPVSLGDGVSVAFSAGGLLDQSDTFSLRPLKQAVAAQDAKVRLGGSSSLTISSASNTVTDIIPGLTLNLKAQSATTATLTISDDPKPAKDAITKFVTSFNAAAKYLNDNTGFDPLKREAGVLQSQSSLRRGMNDLVRGLTSTVAGLPSAMSALSAIGISLDQKGLLTINEETLDAKLAGDLPGVASLFTNTATSTNTGVEFVALTGKTKLLNPFAVSVSQAASRATLTADSALAVSTTISGSNNSFSVKANGIEVALTLASGDYTQQQLADHVAAVIAAKKELKDAAITVSLDAGKLVLQGSRYGSSQSITAVSGTSLTSLGLTAAATASGKDVQGTIDGISVIGQGQALDGKVGTASEGLTLLVSLTAAQVAAGNVSAKVAPRKGIAQRADEVVAALTNPSGGIATSYEDNLIDQIEQVSASVKKIDANLLQRRARYEAQFLQMEKLMQSFQSQGNLLSGQIRGFENMASARRR